MKKIFLMVIMCALFMPALSTAESSFKPRAVTKPGHIELIDVELEVVTIEGKDYRIDDDVLVRKEGADYDISMVSAGDFVIASIRDDVVVKMTVVPPGNGF
jgi:hypothetical protein